MSELESSYGPADLDPDGRFRAAADDAAGATVDAAGATVNPTGATVDAAGAAEAVAVGGAAQVARGAPVARNWLTSVALSFAALAIVVVAILGVLVVT
jgi:hypothetical protein